MQIFLHMVLNISFYRCGRSSGVERNLAKVDVEGPNPFARSNSITSFMEVFFMRATFQAAQGLLSTDGIYPCLKVRIACCFV